MRITCALRYGTAALAVTLAASACSSGGDSKAKTRPSAPASTTTTAPADPVQAYKAHPAWPTLDVGDAIAVPYAARDANPDAAAAFTEVEKAVRIWKRVAWDEPAASPDIRSYDYSRWPAQVLASYPGAAEAAAAGPSPMTPTPDPSKPPAFQAGAFCADGRAVNWMVAYGMIGLPRWKTLATLDQARAVKPFELFHASVAVRPFDEPSYVPAPIAFRDRVSERIVAVTWPVAIEVVYSAPNTESEFVSFAATCAPGFVPADGGRWRLASFAAPGGFWSFENFGRKASSPVYVTGDRVTPRSGEVASLSRSGGVYLYDPLALPG